MTDLRRTQILAVLETAQHNLSVVIDQLISLDDIEGVDVSEQVKELAEALSSLDTKVEEIS